MKFENTKVFNLEGAFRGLRFPMKSNSKSDSDFNNNFIGKNDMNLAQRMIKAGNPNDKFLRQIFISTDITGPRYFWSEFDTYSVGVTKDSESTMHTGAKEFYTMDNFDVKDDGITVHQWGCDRQLVFIARYGRRVEPDDLAQVSKTVDVSKTVRFCTTADTLL